MPVSRSTTIAMLLATIATAVGLNLSVLGLNEQSVESTGGEPTAVAAEPAEDAPLTAQPLADPEAPPQAPPPGPPDGGAVLVVADTSGGAVASPATTIAGEPTTAEPTSSTPPVETSGPATTAPTTEQSATTPPPTTARPTTQPPPTTRPASSEPGEAVEYLTDEFRGVATIQVALHGGQRLELLAVSPVAGMAYLVETETSTLIEIKFRPRTGGEEAEWRIRLDDGRPRIDKER